MRALILAAVCLAVAVPAQAIPIRVDFTVVHDVSQEIEHPFPLPEGSGYFIFDSSLWPDLTQAALATGVLSELSIDYNGKHWGLEDASTISLFWDPAQSSPTLPDPFYGHDGWFGFRGWILTGPDLILGGSDSNSGGGILDGEAVRTTTWQSVSIPEPPVLPLFAAGAFALLIATRRKGSALAVLGLCLAAVPAGAFPIRVNIWVTEYPPGLTQSYLAATGGFTFDSDYFVLQSASGDPTFYTYTGLVPADELEDAGVDFFTGPHQGTHWDISDVSLDWREVFPIREGHIGFPQWSWWWFGRVGPQMMGGDGLGFFGIGDYSYGCGWSAELASEDDQGEDEQASLPEPPMLPLFAMGALAVLMGTRARKGASDIRH